MKNANEMYRMDMDSVGTVLPKVNLDFFIKANKVV